MLISAWLMLLAAYPVFYLMVAVTLAGHGNFCRRFPQSRQGMVQRRPALADVEQFPVETRAVGVAFSYSLSVTIFGGFAPFVATWLIAATGDSLSPAYYLMATAFLSIVALMMIRRSSR